MVYRGKPSAGCGECRKRRSRCDRAVPACGQCVKAKRTCPGYRNTTDLMFLDESKLIAKKGASGASTQTTAWSTPVQLTDVVFYQPLNDLAVNFFMSNYIGSDPMTAQFSYLPSFYARESSSCVELQQSIRAVGLAGYAKITPRPDLIQNATKNYVSAIREVNKVLSNPTSAGRDSTLLCVLLLGMFEVMVLPRTSGLQNMTKHLNGAISIALLRLKQRQRSEIGQKLLGTLLQSVVMNSWIQNIPLPSNFRTLREQLGERTNPSSVHANLLDIVTDLIIFQQAVDEEIYTSPTIVIAEALKLDNRFKIFLAEMPAHGWFENVQAFAEEELLTYQGYYHIYAQNFIAHLWNNARSSRMQLHRAIMAQCHILLSSPTNDDYTFMSKQLSESEVTIRALAEDICATVPQLAGYLEQLRSYLLRMRKGMPHKVRHSPKSDEPHLPTTFNSANVELSTHFVYDPGPTSAERNDAPKQIFPTLTQPKPSSLYHILFQLYTFPFALLPEDMGQWVRNRIQWLESKADPIDLERLQMMLQGHTRLKGRDKHI